MQTSRLGRPKDLKKRQAILTAAQSLFLQYGYEGSSMDRIAKQAQVSKLTVYNHFHDKTQLFAAAIEMVCEQHLPKEHYQLDKNTNIVKKLTHLGNAFLQMIYSHEAIKLSQLMYSHIRHHPELVQLFYQSGPARTLKHLTTFFQEAQTLKLLELSDPEQSTRIFLSLLTDHRHDQVIWGICAAPDPIEIEHIVIQRLDLFLRLYPLLEKNCNNS